MKHSKIFSQSDYRNRAYLALTELSQELIGNCLQIRDEVQCAMTFELK